MRGETITAHIPGEFLDPPQRDAQGALVRAPDTDVPMRGMKLAPHDSTERGQFDPVTMSSYQVYGPAPAVGLPASTTFTIRGQSGWQLEGEIGPWVSGVSGQSKGVEFTVKRGA